MFAKKLKNYNLQPKKLRSFLVFLLILTWLFSGWPQIWRDPVFTPEVKDAHAANNNGMVVYGEGTLTTSRYRNWDGTNFGAESSALVGNATIQYVVVKESPARDEKIMGTLASNGNINFQVWNGTSWSYGTGAPAGGNYGNVGTTNDAYRGFDIAYEQNSGDAIVIYETSTTANQTVGFRTWNGTVWSGETLLSIPTGVNNTSNWIKLEPRSGSDEIMLVIQDSNLDIYALRWDGTSWVNGQLLTTAGTINTSDGFDIAWEGVSGDALVMYGTGTALNFWTFSGGVWTNGTAGSTCTNTGTGPGCLTPAAVVHQLKLTSGSGNNYIAMILIDAGADVTAQMWDGTQWLGVPSAQATWEDSIAELPSTTIRSRTVETAFEQVGNRFLFIYIDANALSIDYFFFDLDVNGWRTNDGTTALTDIELTGTTANLFSDDVEVVHLDSNPDDTAQIMLTGTSLLNDARSFLWNGSSWTTPTQSLHDAAVSVDYMDPIYFTWNRAPSNTITVGLGLAQPANVIEGANDALIGAFTFIGSQPGPATITQIIITETNPLFGANIHFSDVRLFFKQETICSSAIPIDATPFNTPGVGFSSPSNKSTINATNPISLGTNQICVWVRLDIGDQIIGGDDFAIEISTSGDVTASGGTVSGTFPVQLGTTNIRSNFGTIRSTIIDFDWVPGQTSFGQLIWTTTEPANTDVVMRVRYESAGVCNAASPLVEEAQLAGNVAGFQSTQSPLSLSGLLATGIHNRICLEATLSATSGATASPSLDDWRVTWQGAPAGPSLSAFRFFQDPGTPDVGAQITGSPATLATNGLPFRMRFLVHAPSAIGINAETYRLQFAERSGTCDPPGWVGETWTPVSNNSLIAYTNNASVVDDSVFTANVNDPTHGTDVIINQTYNDSDADPPGTIDTFTNPVAIGAGQDGKWDFALVDFSAPSNRTYCLRVVKNSDSTSITHDAAPEIAVNTQYATDGTYQSPQFSVPAIRALNVLEWNETVSGPCTGSPPCDIKLRIRSAATQAGLSTALWCGPDGTCGTTICPSGTSFYTIPSGTRIPTIHNTHTWFQYCADFDGDSTATPILNWVRINYQ